MKPLGILLVRDGVSLRLEDGVMWLAVHDAVGSHSTSLTDEGRADLARVLRSRKRLPGQRDVFGRLEGE
jgi:hypothetical protein